MHRILIPLDGSPLAETVMPTAIELGQALNAEWVLLRVIPAYPSGWTVAAGAWGPVEAWDEILETGPAAQAAPTPGRGPFRARSCRRLRSTRPL